MKIKDIMLLVLGVASAGLFVKSCGDDAALPWHRVLRADGRIAFPAGSEGFVEQARRLKAEGVSVRNGRVAMPARELDLDAEVWGMR